MRWSCKAVKHFSKSGGQSILEHCSTLTSTVRSLQFLGKTCKWGNFQQIDLKYQFHGQLTLLVRGGGHIVPPPSKYRFKSGYLGARTPQTHWLFLNMYEKWYTNVFGVISLRGPPRGPTFFLAPPEKMLKSTVFELEQWFLHQNGPFFHQEFNGKGLWVLGSQFQNSWNFWIFGSWTQSQMWSWDPLTIRVKALPTGLKCLNNRRRNTWSEPNGIRK